MRMQLEEDAARLADPWLLVPSDKRGYAIPGKDQLPAGYVGESGAEQDPNYPGTWFAPTAPRESRTRNLPIP